MAFDFKWETLRGLDGMTGGGPTMEPRTQAIATGPSMPQTDTVDTRENDRRYKANLKEAWKKYENETKRLNKITCLLYTSPSPRDRG